MKKHFFTTRLLLVMAVWIGSCTKDKKDGQGGFTANVNGKELAPCTPSFTNGGPIRTSAYFHTVTHGSLSISARNHCDRNFVYGRNVTISFDSILLANNTTYKFGNGAYAVNGQVVCTYSEDLKRFVSDSSLPGSITLQGFNPSDRTISARFEATLRDEISGQLIMITQGSFNLKY